MQKVSYIYSGETRTFYFNFPYFEKSNIVVTVDNKPAPAYNVIGNKGGSNPDFPFTSGRIVFEKPLKKFETITIERHLPYVRPVDFQPTVQITPSALNLDMNYTMELLKDIKDEFDSFREKYADIVDKESTNLLLEKIDMVNQNISQFAEEIAALDGISDVMKDIDELQDNVANQNTEIENLQSSIDNIIQNPTPTLPDYAATPISLSTSTGVWTTAPTSGVLHIKFMTNNEISWLSVALGSEDNYLSLATHVNADARLCDVVYYIKAGQKFKLSPRNATINTCALYPLC